MSKAQLDKFIGLVSNDPAVLQEASKGVEQADEFIKNVVAYGKQHGYDFTEDEAKDWIGDQGKQRAGGELSDAQLEMVAGGKSPGTKKFLNDLTGFLDSHLGPKHGPAHGHPGHPPKPPIHHPPFPHFPGPKW